MAGIEPNPSPTYPIQVQDYPRQGIPPSTRDGDDPSNPLKRFLYSPLEFPDVIGQFVAATTFRISGFPSFYIVHDTANNPGLLDGVFWIH
ncbi:hypothetical protein ONZ45_g17720 [Pleurotus djamor]|nr:hypothetical protein ONZ45_g17720 [Pleurotus djamor]